MGKSVTSGMPASPGTRFCCLLGTYNGPFWNVLHPQPETYRHVYGSGGLFPANRVGLMYTCAGGFIDFGHLRDVGDLTKFYYDALLLKPRKGEVIESKGLRGKVTILEDVPPEKQVDVARSIAYAESIYHEIETYWHLTPGDHNSSFSPEDLVSNFFGTYVAAKAIRDDVSATFGNDYNTRFAVGLGLEMTLLGAVDSLVTEAALERVEGTWIQGSQLSSGYLRRRNFAMWPLHPWLLNGYPVCTTGRFPTATTIGFAIPEEASTYYTADYEVPEASRSTDDAKGIPEEVVNVSQFDSLIFSIRRAAFFEYGSDFDSPAPVGRVGP